MYALVQLTSILDQHLVAVLRQCVPVLDLVQPAPLCYERL